MKNRKKKSAPARTRPKYIKDERGRTVQVYLDIKMYESMVKRAAEWDKMKKSFPLE